VPGEQPGQDLVRWERSGAATALHLCGITLRRIHKLLDRGATVAIVERWTGAETKALRQALRLSVRAFAERELGVSVRSVSNWESRGADITPVTEMQRALDTALARADSAVKERFSRLIGTESNAQRPPTPETLPAEAVGSAPAPPSPPAVDEGFSVESPVTWQQVESLRRAVQDALSEGAMTNASLDDWDQTVWRYGAATKHRSADLLLGDLTSDFVELKRVLTRCRSASAMRRLTRTAAHMSGLMCLTLIKLDERAAFRGWARTARIAAAEAGDPETRSWVLAQEAYGHYYSDELAEAVDVAREAQMVAMRQPCVGSVLAAALEARAHAALGNAVETRRALQEAETILSGLNADGPGASAFGYNEAQLRFHESNALTHLGDIRAAWQAQDRALALVAPGDFMDEAFTQLDRAMCLAKGGDVATAVAHTTHTLLSLTAPQRTGIIGLRARQIVEALPLQTQGSVAVRELDDLLQTTSVNPKE
jgi:transcriptional regulator with XRE-family HTH domain